MTDNLKIDLGCGGRKYKPEFIGVDGIKFPGVDVVADLRLRWPFDDNTVEEAYASHFLEHLTHMERVHFANELYRVMKAGAKATIITPHWASCRAYGDPTHQWAPVSEFWYFYLSRKWRLGDDKTPGNAPHTDAQFLANGFNCDFEASWGYSLHPSLQGRNNEYREFAIANFKESANDLVGTITKR